VLKQNAKRRLRFWIKRPAAFSAPETQRNTS
jgi:hypothetical protein